jgi:hypothetical protein
MHSVLILTSRSRDFAFFQRIEKKFNGSRPLGEQSKTSGVVLRRASPAAPYLTDRRSGLVPHKASAGGAVRVLPLPKIAHGAPLSEGLFYSYPPIDSVPLLRYTTTISRFVCPQFGVEPCLPGPVSSGRAPLP